MLGYSLVLPDEIRALRSRYGWTQKELAARLGTDDVTVSRWERGRSQPRPSALRRLETFASDLPSDVQSLLRLVGLSRSRMALKRAILLGRRPRRRRFSADPARRIKQVERALRDQAELKTKARLR
ncbi:MAG: helix-turn-helix domain-containing protein [Actinobacteria bacterium]|nr:helix-turn-helix domain-containing protein [Actinomycetota bacterium]